MLHGKLIPSTSIKEVKEMGQVALNSNLRFVTRELRFTWTRLRRDVRDEVQSVD